MRNTVRSACFILFHAVILSISSSAQTSITSSGAVTQTFDGMASGTALPANWKMSAAGTGTSTLGWADVSNVTTTSFAAHSGTPATGGRYNWGTTAGTDRSVGVMTDAAYSTPNAIMAWYRNTSGATIHSLTISFNVERYKVDASTTSVTFFTSSDGIAWTQQPLANIDPASFAPGPLSYTFDIPTTVSRSLTFNNMNLANNGNIYLKWIIVNTGSTNAQGLGLDDVAIAVNTPTITANLGDILTDANANNTANPGEIITYRDTIKNTGLADALSVVVADTTAPAGTTKVTGSTKTSAVAVDDSYTASYNTQLTAVNVLTNDFGFPAPQVISYGTTASGGVTTAAGGAGATDNGGTIVISANGSLTYTPATNFSGVDKFKYIAGTGVGLPDNDAVVFITVSPSGISFTAVVVQPACNGSANGTITINASGGSGTYLYSKDNGTNFQASNVFNNLAAGTYQLVVKDAITGATQSASEVLTNPAAVTLTFTKTDITCNGLGNGTITFNTASGGTGPYTYSITGTGGTFQSSNSFTGLAANTYTLAVKDNNGCLSATSSTTVVDPPLVVVNGTTPVALIYNTAMTTVTYTKTGGTGTPATPWSATGLPTGVSINTATGDVTGTPTVTGVFNAVITYTDANGCTGSKNVTINVAPKLTGDSYTAVGNTQLVADGHSTPATPHTTSATNILTNDASDAAITVTAGTFATTNGGSITIDAAGKFIYSPKAGSNTADTYIYTATSNGVSATATISFTVSNMVWYVNNTFVGTSDGTSAKPYTDVASAETASSANQIIYVHTGTGSTAGNALLKSGQTLRGAGSALSVGALSIAAGTKPTLSGTITLASNVTVDGFDMNTVAPIAFTNAGSTVTGVTVNVGNVAANSATGITITGTGNNVSMTLASLTTTGAVNAVNLVGTAGTVTINAGTQTNTTGPTFNVSGSTVNLTYSGSVTHTSNNPAVNVLNGHTGTITFQTGTISVTNGTGLQFENADGTYNFLGTTTLNGGDAGIDIINGSDGTFNFATTSGSIAITSPSGIAFNVGGTSNLATITYDGNITQANNAAMVNITNHATNAINFPAGNTLSATNGTGLQFDNADGTYNFSGTNTLNGGDAGIDILNGSGGAFTFSSNSTITNPTGTAFNIGSVTASSGGGGNVTYNGTISKTSSGRAIEIQNKTGGTVAFSGTVSGTTSSTGINLATNTGATINFTNVVTLNGTAAVFTATGGGTVTSNNATSTIGNTTAPTTTALNISNTAIGAAGIIFQKISCSGGTNGIIINTTGSAGGLTISGTGSAGTGGTIQNTTASGILLTSCTGINLNYMNISGCGEDGIEGSSVNGLNLTNDVLTNNGDDSEDAGIRVVNMWGTCSWSNLSVTASELANVIVENTSGTLTNWTISGTSHFDNLGTAFGGNSILVYMHGTAVLTEGSITGATFSNNKPARGITVQSQETATIGNSSNKAFVIQNCEFINNGLHASFEQSGSASATFKFINNGTAAAPMTMPNTTVGTSHAINVFSSSVSTGGSILGTISGNYIGNAAVAGSGSPGGNGIRVFIQAKTTSALLISNNTIRQTPQARGVDIQYVGQTTAGQPIVQHDVTVTNNNVIPSDITGFPSGAIVISADNQGSPARVRCNVTGNSVPSSPAVTGDYVNAYIILANVAAGAEMQLVDTTSPISGTASSELSATNTGSTGTTGTITLIAGPIIIPF